MKRTKKIFIFIILLGCFLLVNIYKTFAQGDILSRDTRFWYQVTIGKQASIVTDSTAWLEIGKDSTNKGFILPRVVDTSSVVGASKGNLVFQDLDSIVYVNNGSKWKQLGGSGNVLVQQLDDSTYVIGQDTIHMLSASYINFNGNRPITRDFSTLMGVNLGTTDIKSTLNQLLYPSQTPTSSLTASYNGVSGTSLQLEKTSQSTIPIKFIWGAGRKSYTDSISSIVVNGDTIAFTQPAPGQTIVDSQINNVATNNYITISNVVNTSDNKSSSSFVSISFQTKWYYGFINPSITNPSDVDILSLPNQELTTSRIQNNGNGSNIIVPNTTNNRFVIVEDASLDPSNINQIMVGGLNSTGAFTKTTRSFTNALGYTYQVNIYVSNNTTSGQYNFQIQ